MSIPCACRGRAPERGTGEGWGLSRAGGGLSYREQDVKRVYYLSMEFLMGRSLLNALYNLQISGPYSEVRRSLAPFSICTTGP